VSDSNVELTFSQQGKVFYISEQCKMPALTVTANVKNPKSPLTGIPQYEWKVTLVFNGTGYPHATGRVTNHPEIKATTATNQFTIPFTTVRGGDLTVSVTVRAEAQSYQGSTIGYKILGTNPTIGSLQTEISLLAGQSSTTGFKKLMRLESSLMQFFGSGKNAGIPIFSQDNLGGVGLCQITDPTRFDFADFVWSWKVNLSQGWKLYKSKEKVAKNYPVHVRASSEFKQLVTNYNQARIAAAQAAAKPGAPAAAAGTAAVLPLTISLPDYTTDQLERDTLRGFNGFAGGLHEYRVQVDANGALVVQQITSTTGSAAWEQVTAAMRTAYYDDPAHYIKPAHRGDPNYVDDVERQQSF
jgi:hypothetical protein